MKKEAILWSCVGLLLFGAMSRADDQRAYLGVILDDTPLPELLMKHLQLAPEQGVRIANVMIGGPADKAGLDRDDLIIAFQGAKVTDRKRFVDAVRGAGVGTEATLEVIHLGQRKTVSVKLESAPEEKTMSWKYPPEPEAFTPWHMGRIFKIGPDGRELLEVPFDRIPDIGKSLRRFSRETYVYHRATDDGDYTITIQGDPADEGSELVVQAGDQKYPATVGSIESLPEKYREPARQAVKDACAGGEKGVHVRRFAWPENWGPEARRKFFESLPQPDLQRLLEQKDQALEKLQKQMEQLQQRVKQMEERLHQRAETRKNRSAEPQGPASTESSDKAAI
jgi:hypothetical protein